MLSNLLMKCAMAHLMTTLEFATLLLNAQIWQVKYTYIFSRQCVFFYISFREVRLMGFVRKALVSVVFVSVFFLTI